MLGYRTQIWTYLLNDCAPHAIFWIRHLVSVYVKQFVRLYVMFCQQRRREGCLRHQGIIDFSPVRAPVCFYFVQDRFVMTVRRRWINERQKTPFRFNFVFRGLEYSSTSHVSDFESAEKIEVLHFIFQPRQVVTLSPFYIIEKKYKRNWFLHSPFIHMHSSFLFFFWIHVKLHDYPFQVWRKECM